MAQAHEHVRIAVADADRPGSEHVAAERLDEGLWRLIRSPLYAMSVASGDVVRVVDEDAGLVEVVERGGNVCVQFYLAPEQADDADATERIAESLKAKVAKLGGGVDGLTPGLISFTVPAAAGFRAIERTFQTAAKKYAGAQWQYGNVYDEAGEPLGWWER